MDEKTRQIVRAAARTICQKQNRIRELEVELAYAEKRIRELNLELTEARKRLGELEARSSAKALERARERARRLSAGVHWTSADKAVGGRVVETRPPAPKAAANAAKAPESGETPTPAPKAAPEKTVARLGRDATLDDAVQRAIAALPQERVEALLREGLALLKDEQRRARLGNQLAEAERLRELIGRPTPAFAREGEGPEMEHIWRQRRRAAEVALRGLETRLRNVLANEPELARARLAAKMGASLKAPRKRK